MNDSLLQNAMQFHQSGNFSEAARLYQEILQANPRNAQALFSFAFLCFQARRFEDAEILFGAALRLEPRSPDALCIRGVALLELRRPAEALPNFEAALAINPRFVEACCNRATTLMELGRPNEALAGFDRTLELTANDINVWNNRGNALFQLTRFADALASYDRALALDARHPEALFNRGNAFLALSRHAEAVASYDGALAVKPEYAESWARRGDALAALRRFSDAIASYDQALAHQASMPAAVLTARAEALFGAGRLEEAIADCEAALAIEPDFPLTRGHLVFWRLLACDWQGLNEAKARISADLEAGKLAIDPFKNAVVSSSPAEQLRGAQLWVAHRAPAMPGPAPSPRARKTDKIRIAYVSSDFRVHATAYLTAGLFERHDKDRFETVAVSFGPTEQTAMRTRLHDAFHEFIDVEGQSDDAIAQTMRERAIDIAVDLKGVTTESRFGIFARKPAPLQVAFLGFPGTTGASYIDYLVADRIVIPESDRRFYAEKILYLPDTYQPNDSTRAGAERTPGRTDAGLPETGFVFCSFNSSYKITPEVFALWMRLLRDVPGSVLWLLEANPMAVDNLARAAEAHGIAARRLIFAPFLPMDEHLARLRHADVFLDALPCNAHTTASDALWAGVPVLTCLGTTFAGRVAASLLHANGMAEMATTSLADYEALALRLARDRDALDALKAKTARNRDTHALFDTARFCRHLEAGYISIWERFTRGEPADHIFVDPIS